MGYLAWQLEDFSQSIKNTSSFSLSEKFEKTDVHHAGPDPVGLFQFCAGKYINK